MEGCLGQDSSQRTEGPNLAHQVPGTRPRCREPSGEPRGQAKVSSSAQPPRLQVASRKEQRAGAHPCWNQPVPRG